MTNDTKKPTNEKPATPSKDAQTAKSDTSKGSTGFKKSK